MSYTALYRKYRPSNFSSVVGQEVVVNILKNSIVNNKISHAYLFTGPRGTGKTSIAKIFAHAVNCLNFTNDICGECEICKNLAVNDSDIIEIDAASNNGVDEIRTLRDNVKLMPSFCKYKIYIIDEVHMLSTGAFNALLKTLEEPPSHVIFILATTEPNKIPLTILSRCQRFDFNKISKNDLIKRLSFIANEENKSIDDTILSYIADISDGGLRDAINLLDQVIFLPNEDITLEEIDKLSGRISKNTLFSMLEAISSGNFVSILDISDKIYSDGKNYKDIAEGLLSIIRDISINNEVSNYFDKTYSDKLSTFNIKKYKLVSVTSKLNDLIKELKISNDPKMIFDIYMVDLCNSLIGESDNKIISSKSEDEVINNSNEVKKEELEVIDNLSSNENNQNKDINTLNENKEDIELNLNDDLINIRVNNVLAEADKNTLKIINDMYDKISEYVSNKQYNTIAILLLDGHVCAASNKYLLFAFDNEGDVRHFNSINKKIESFTKEVFDSQYKVVAVTSKEWENIKVDYIKNKKNQIPYIFIEENDVKLDIGARVNELEGSALDIFGEDTISVR